MDSRAKVRKNTFKTKIMKYRKFSLNFFHKNGKENNLIPLIKSKSKVLKTHLKVNLYKVIYITLFGLMQSCFKDKRDLEKELKHP
jgi:hypothetical protein